LRGWNAIANAFSGAPLVRARVSRFLSQKT
jgi:hypothetical protein